MNSSIPFIVIILLTFIILILFVKNQKINNQNNLLKIEILGLKKEIARILNNDPKI